MTYRWWGDYQLHVYLPACLTDWLTEWSMDRLTKQLINQLTNQLTEQCPNQGNNELTNWPMDQSTNQPTNQPTNQLKIEKEHTSRQVSSSSWSGFKTTLYIFNSQIYIQTDGVATGGAASSNTEQNYMQTHEQTAISTALHAPKV